MVGCFSFPHNGLSYRCLIQLTLKVPVGILSSKFLNNPFAGKTGP